MGGAGDASWQAGSARVLARLRARMSMHARAEACLRMPGVYVCMYLYVHMYVPMYASVYTYVLVFLRVCELA